MAYEYVRVKRYRARRRRRSRYLLCLVPVALAALWRFSPLYSPPEQMLQFHQQTRQEDASAAERARREYTLHSQTWYTLQLGAFGDMASARTMAETFRSRGAAGVIWPEGEHHLVLAAAYDSRESALQVQDNLQQYHQVDTVIKPVSIPEVRLQMQGTKGQLQSLCDALDCLSNLQHSLYHLSLSADRGEMDPAAVREALVSHRGTLEALQSGLTKAFSGDMPDAAARLSQALSALIVCLDDTLGQNGSVRFGAGVKQAQLLCISELTGWSGKLAINNP